MPMIIAPVFNRNRYWISSVELYDLLGKDKKKYSRWVALRIKGNNSLRSPEDYHLHRQFISGRKGAQRSDYHISITLALAICITEGTNLSMNVRYCIESTVKELIQKRKNERNNGTRF